MKPDIALRMIDNITEYDFTDCVKSCFILLVVWHHFHLATVWGPFFSLPVVWSHFHFFWWCGNQFRFFLMVWSHFHFFLMVWKSVSFFFLWLCEATFIFLMVWHHFSFSDVVKLFHFSDGVKNHCNYIADISLNWWCESTVIIKSSHGCPGIHPLQMCMHYKVSTFVCHSSLSARLSVRLPLETPKRLSWSYTRALAVTSFPMSCCVDLKRFFTDFSTSTDMVLILKMKHMYFKDTFPCVHNISSEPYAFINNLHFVLTFAIHVPFYYIHITQS